MSKVRRVDALHIVVEEEQNKIQTANCARHRDRDEYVKTFGKKERLMKLVQEERLKFVCFDH